MESLLDPNIAYLLLAGGLILAVLAVLNPGTGVLEIGGLLLLLLAGGGVYYFSEQGQVNWWSLLVILVGVVLFAVAFRYPRQPVYLIVSIACLVLGSVFLFHGKEWYIPAVNPFLAISVSVSSGIFFWVATNKIVEARNVQPTHDLEALVGKTGEAQSEIDGEGTVQVSGELWTARSEQPIPSGAKVRVTHREGFVLVVEALEGNNS